MGSEKSSGAVRDTQREQARTENMILLVRGWKTPLTE
jgi:hypothetical protein